LTSYFKQLTKDEMEVVDERGFIGNSRASIKSAKTLSILSSAVMSFIDLTDDLSSEFQPALKAIAADYESDDDPDEYIVSSSKSGLKHKQDT
jgi:hypothetical protein